MRLIPHRPTARLYAHGIQSLKEFGRRVAPYLDQCFTPVGYQRTLTLKLFRREPAITEFVWHFTPSHSSSEPFVTDTGSGLHVALPPLHPDHG
jgi:hypothetical protein